MPAKTKSARLSKAAKELNVGTQTIIDFLSTKGIEIENNPNYKLDAEVFELLVEEFAASKQLKEKSQKLGVPTTKRETISIHEDREKGDSSKTTADEESEEVLIKNTQGTEEVVKTKVETKKPHVVGKIDLDKHKPKARPAAEKETPPAETGTAKEKAEPTAAAESKKEPAAEAPETTPEKKETVEAKGTEAAEKPSTEKPAAEEPKSEGAAKKNEPAAEEAKPAKTESGQAETIQTQFKKLTGPTVVGKIELPKEKSKKKKPIMSTDPETETQKGKRKRKRIQTSRVNVQPGQAGAKKGKGAPAGKKGVAPRRELSQEDIDRELKETLAKLSGGAKSRAAKHRRSKRDEHGKRMEERLQQEEQEATILRLTEFVTVSELANLMNASPTEVISACMSLGIMVSINQRLDAETISIIAEEFGYTVEFTTAEVQESIPLQEDTAEELQPRAPIVTVMGHVDHGKTSLLDYIRKENVIAGEAGGITQHIGAYSVEVGEGKRITFLDTPGHEAFTAMRARGAQVTDLAIIVVAADDEVMPQTREAINHAQAAGIPMIFAINKIDKPNANPDKIKEQLAGMNILVEDWGGKYQSQDISAKKGTNVEDLLEKVLLEAEVLELTANPNKRALGTVIESSLDKGRGFVTTLIVEAGTLKMGDAVLAGQYSGKVKAMFNERGNSVKSAGPSIPVTMLGLDGAPNAGDKFYVLEDEREARSIAAKREQLQREQGVRAQKHITLDEIGRRIAIGDFKELNVIIKGDVDGSLEALTDSLQKLSTEKIQVNVIHKAVGQITESDVLLASASDAIIIGFQVRPSASARKLAEKEEIQIKIYSVIYAAIEEVRDAMEGMLSAKIEERVVGNAEIRETFKISKVGTIAGCFVTDGKITRNSKVRVIRDGIVVYSGNLGSLKRFKDDVKEVAKGYECGLNIDKFNDIKEGDIVEAFEEVEVKQTL